MERAANPGSKMKNICQTQLCTYMKSMDFASLGGGIRLFSGTDVFMRARLSEKKA